MTYRLACLECNYISTNTENMTIVVKFGKKQTDQKAVSKKLHPHNYTAGIVR